VIEQLKVKKGIQDADPAQLEKAKLQEEEELRRLEEEKKSLEGQIADEEKRHRTELRKWEKKIKASEEKLESLQKELKEKEQENRISKLKIKEMRRLIKHNQLKPLAIAAAPENEVLEVPS
jgi:hypothetical protein